MIAASAGLRDDVTEAGVHGSPEAGGVAAPDECASTMEVRWAIFSPRMQVVIHIEWEGRNYRLRGPFAIQLEQLDAETVFASHKTLPVHGYGPTTRDALEAFAAMFDAQWQNVAAKADSALTPNAQTVKAQLKNLVDRVEGCDTCQR